MEARLELIFELEPKIWSSRDMQGIRDELTRIISDRITRFKQDGILRIVMCSSHDHELCSYYKQR